MKDRHSEVENRRRLSDYSPASTANALGLYAGELRYPVVTAPAGYCKDEQS